ncbi:MAG: penicillin-binding protein 1A [Myxococcota bacterium]
MSSENAASHTRARRWLRITAWLGGVGVVCAAAGAVAFYLAFLTDLPDLESVDDYRPSLTSLVLDREGRPVGEFFLERRRLVPIEEIPRHAQLAFVAAEDSAFFEHSGIDYVSILRAAWVDVVAGEIRQGASTITMQLVKQLLLSPERRFRRKIREMILARQLESRLSKQDILYLYLNHIYFGHGAHGIGEAAFTYFDKTVPELTVGEAALLAGLPQRPSAYSPYRNPEAAERRRQYVLRRMLDDGVIDQAAYDEAAAAPVELRPPVERERYAFASYFTEEVRRYLFERLGGDIVLGGGLTIETTLDIDLQEAAVRAVHKGLIDHDRRQGYRGHVRRVAASEVNLEAERLAEENGIEPPDAPEVEDAEVPDGEAGSLAEEAAASEPAEVADATGADPATGTDDEQVEPEPPAIREPRLPIGEPRLAVVLDVDDRAGTARVAFAPDVEGLVELETVSWARPVDPTTRPRPVKKISKVFAAGDVAWFERLPEPDLPEADEQGAADEPDAEAPLPPLPVTLAQEPEVQGALLSIDVPSGDVMSMVGGYDFEKSQFNRATQALRQPGSAFKPFIYGAALSRDYTPVSILYDRPVVYEDPISGFVWRPQNYSRHFYGPMPMRAALVRSVNNATVHLFRDVGVDYVIDFARRLGIQAPLQRDLSLALGSSSVTLLELTSAYAVFPNRGRRVTPRFITRVTDRDGQVLLEDVPLGNPPPPVLKPLDGGDAADEAVYPDGEILPTEQIISEDAAYLMCDLLMAVVKDPRGTGWRLRKLGRPLGGKTGTTNDQADAWFMGFSPGITTGVWVGHDESRVLGWGETGSRAAAPIWVDYMKVALADRPIRDFEVPDHIVFQRIDRATGLLADAKTPDAYFQPFLEGSEPTKSSATVSSATDTRRALRDDAF